MSADKKKATKPRPGQAANPTSETGLRLSVSDTLIDLALVVARAWDMVDLEAMEGNGWVKVRLKYVSQAAAEEQYPKLGSWHSSLLGRGFDLPAPMFKDGVIPVAETDLSGTGSSRHPVDLFPPVLKGETVTLFLEDFLPSRFSDLLNDVAVTELAHVPVTEEQVGLMQVYLDAFAPDQIISLDVLQDGNAEDSVTATSKESLFQAQQAWFEFLQGCLDAMGGKSHFVVIHEDLTISIDGKTLEKTSSSAGRGLLVLALLRRHELFTAQTFMGLYSNEPTEHAKRFNDVATTLKEKLPKLAYRQEEALRSIRNVQFRVYAHEKVIRDFLAQHYKSTSKKVS